MDNSTTAPKALHTHHYIIIGSGPATRKVAIFAAHAELKPTMFEVWMANDIISGGQLTTTTDIKSEPGLRTATALAYFFRVYFFATAIEVDALVIAISALAYRLHFPEA
ncbi:putative Thioredoxin reductase 1, mitochondrial [Cocos nucifera]|uniref:Putative Thioredoxin reductase 1, mitochondrial n=1 Tax=Cocos nucifera TaxID=13894 RepID=A0A8K0N922_COCNU|nr:putative Thioredoxin reductase 1, mitochondrial [Cocos nucifera]